MSLKIRSVVATSQLFAVHLQTRSAVATRQLLTVHFATALQRAVAGGAQTRVVRVATIAEADAGRHTVGHRDALAVVVAVNL